MMRKVLCIFIFISLLPGLRGQVAPFSDHYILNPMLINPAGAGLRGALSIAAVYRKQWVGIEGAPETIMILADSPLAGTRTGIGLSIIADKTGVTRETSIGGTYSYSIDMREGNLSFGLKAGFMATNTAWSDLFVLDPGDELYLVDSKTFIVPDFSFGAYLSTNRYYAGFSIPRLMGYDFIPEKNRYALKFDPRQYYYMFQGGYIVEYMQGIRFIPSALLVLSPGEKILADFNAHFNFSEKMWAGASYRTNNSLAGLFQFAISDQLKAAYSYYLDLGRFGRFSNGSHEIMLRFDFLIRADVVSPLIF